MDSTRVLKCISVNPFYYFKANAITLAVPTFLFFYLRNTLLPYHLIQLTILSSSFLLVLWVLRSEIRASNLTNCVLMKFFISFSIVLLLQSIWAYTFSINYILGGYRGDIFREAFLRPHAPIYGESELLPNIVIASAIFIMAIGIIVLLKTSSQPMYERRYKIIYGFVFIIFATTFALSESQERLLTYYAQQSSFYVDSKLFDGPVDLLRNYVKTIPLLSNRGQHYPPGNLLVIAAGNKMGLSYGLKALCYFSPLIGFFYLDKLLSVLGFSNEEKRFSLFLYLFGFGTIAFISTSTTPLLMALFIVASYTGLKKKRGIGHFYPVITGIVLSVSLLLSFSAVVMIAFLFITDFFMCIHNKRIATLVLRWLIIAMVLGLFYLCLFFFFGFNIYECLVVSIENNQKLMTATPYDDVLRYFLRSSGNLIAFFILPNFTAAILSIWAMKELKYTRNVAMRSYASSFFLTILIFSFSGLFYLETERIWLFLMPSLAVIAGYWLKTMPLAERIKIEQFMMVVTILTSFAIELSFQPFI